MGRCQTYIWIIPGHLGHSLSAEVDDQGFLMKAAIPRAEPVTARQAKRWAQTKSSNMPRLRRWLALLMCACTSVGLAHVVSGDEVQEAEAHQCLGQERELKSGTWNQVLSMIKHVEHLVDQKIEPQALVTDMHQEEIIIQKYPHLEDLIKTHMVVMRQQVMAAQRQGCLPSCIIVVNGNAAESKYASMSHTYTMSLDSRWTV